MAGRVDHDQIEVLTFAPEPARQVPRPHREHFWPLVVPRGLRVSIHDRHRQAAFGSRNRDVHSSCTFARAAFTLQQG